MTGCGINQQELHQAKAKTDREKENTPLNTRLCRIDNGEYNKSSQGRADAQRLVTTRLLDRLHDPLGHFSRLQRIYPRAWWHCNPLASPWGILPRDHRQPAEVHGLKAYSYPTTTCGATSPRSGTDSDLEAFSHNPADGSVAALPGQTAAKTNYLNQRFLSY